MLVDTDQMISVSDASRNASRLFKSAAEDSKVFVVMNGSKPTAVISGLDNLDRLNRIDELEEDLRLFSLAIVRMFTDDGERHDLDDVAAEFGIDLNEE
jgi:PHD/YefM family antitoxin component YafN of YafNO toxin-antitoxin module